MNEKEEGGITPENVFEVEVEKLAMDSRFGSLVFKNANEKLSKIQKWLEETSDLEAPGLLLENDINQVLSFTKQLAEHLEWLRLFDIGTVPNAKTEHDNFESRINSYYDQVYQKVVMQYLPFLRGERRRENPDEQKLEEEVRRASQLRSDLEKELIEVRQDIENIRKTGKEVGSAKGARGAIRTASYFNDEVIKYEQITKNWFYVVLVGYAIVMAFIIFLGIFTTSYLKQFFILPEMVDKGVLWGAVVSKLVIITALWYGLSFIIKNYNVNSHLVAINRHRAAVARTLEDFIAVEQQQENPRLSEILQNATEAMFKNIPVGFISKTEREGNSSVLKVINDLIGANNK